MKRILGLDLGSVTCGVSVSDLMGMIASPVETIRFANDDYEDCIEKLKKHIDSYKIDTVILGLPKHMNGDIGIRGNISLEFKKKLEALDLKVILWDERLTTVSAERFLLEADMSRKKRKKVIDQMAAVTILQDYLDSKQ